MTTTSRDDECGAERTPLLMALELGRYQWSVGFTTGMGQRPRRRVLRSEHWARLADEIVAAKRRFSLSAERQRDELLRSRAGWILGASVPDDAGRDLLKRS